MHRHRSRIAVLWLLFVGLLTAGISTVRADDSRILRAGAAVVEITPPDFPVDSAGSMAPRTAEYAHDPLNARCMVLDNGLVQLAIVVCDSCMIPRDVFDHAKQVAEKRTGIPAGHMLMAATHTHTAVTATPVFQSTRDERYCELLVERIAKAVEVAYSRLEPARIGWAVGHNPRQAFNRRWYMRPGFALQDPFERGSDRVRMNPPPASSKLLTPAGGIDPEVPILAVQAVDGRPIAVLANYALHYVGGLPVNTLSADYFGEFARQFARRVQADDADLPVVPILSNGTSGDINNINFFEGSQSRQPFEQIRFVATDVAESAEAAYQRIEYQDWVPIVIAETELDLGVRRPTPAEIERAKQILAAAGERPYRDQRAIYANETLDLADYPATVSVKLQAMRIGSLGIVSSPCETFVETGLAIKAQSPLKPTFTIELANGYNGYLPTPEQHALGGYETWRAKSSYLAVDAEPAIRATLLKLLEKVAAE